MFGESNSFLILVWLRFALSADPQLFFLKIFYKIIALSKNPSIFDELLQSTRKTIFVFKSLKTNRLFQIAEGIWWVFRKKPTGS